MNRDEKSAEIEVLTDCIKRAQIAVCADYRGLTVSKISTLRRDLKLAGSHSRVVKNTLAKISVEKVYGEKAKASLKGFSELFTGPSLLIYSFNDPVSPTKVLAKFAKDNEKFSIKGGCFEGNFIDAKSVEAISTMPGREELMSQLLRVISAPATNLVRLINEPGTQAVRLLEAVRKLRQ